jgi:Protein of unknown function (DUF2000)
VADILSEAQGVTEKTVVIVDSSVPLGFLANAVAVASFSLGQAVPRLCGEETADADGNRYFGVIRIPLPILAATSERMLEIREAARRIDGIVAVDFTEQAQRPQTYEMYAEVMSRTQGGDMIHRALALYGTKKQIDRLTGNLPLLR